MKSKICGVGVALVTPFDESGEVDYAALGQLVDYVTSNGVDYLVVLGTTGETPTLTDQEQAAVVSCVKSRNAGRLPIVVGVGGYSTAKVISTIKSTDLEGVAAILSVTPFYNRPSQEGLYQHYKSVAQESPVPVLLYNVPARTGVNMTPETTLRIAREVPNVMGIKEARGTVAQLSMLLAGRPEGFKIISGDDMLAVSLAAIGGDGVISVAANAFPKAFVQMVKAACEGNVKRTAEMHIRLFEAIAALFEEGNPAGIKAALALKGIARRDVRLPLCEATEGLSDKLKELIERGNI